MKKGVAVKICTLLGMTHDALHNQVESVAYLGQRHQTIQATICRKVMQFLLPIVTLVAGVRLRSGQG
jgi:hypothetical protein